MSDTSNCGNFLAMNFAWIWWTRQRTESCLKMMNSFNWTDSCLKISYLYCIQCLRVLTHVRVHVLHSMSVSMSCNSCPCPCPAIPVLRSMSVSMSCDPCPYLCPAICVLQSMSCNPCPAIHVYPCPVLAFSPLNLSNPQIFRIVKYAKVKEVNR